MAGPNNYPQRKKNILDDQKLKLSVKNQDGKNASLMFNIYDNNPRIVVYTGIEQDRDAGPISARINVKVAFAIIEMLDRSIAFRPTEAAPDIKFKIENKRPNFKPGGGKPEGTVTDTEIFVGKDAKGCVWISVTKYKRPAIKFIIGNDEFHEFYHGSGEKFSQGEVSVLFAKAYSRILTELIPAIMINEYKEPEPRPQNGGGNRGGGYNGGGNRGGGNYGGGAPAAAAPAASGGEGGFEDDLPF